MKTQEKAIQKRNNIVEFVYYGVSIAFNIMLFVYTPLWLFILFQVLGTASFVIHVAKGVKDQEDREAMEAERIALEDAKEEAEYKAWKESLEQEK